jgi:hypothetical protein
MMEEIVLALVSTVSVTVGVLGKIALDRRRNGWNSKYSLPPKGLSDLQQEVIWHRAQIDELYRLVTSLTELVKDIQGRVINVDGALKKLYGKVEGGLHGMGG